MMQESYGSLQAHIIRDLVRPYGPGLFMFHLINPVPVLDAVSKLSVYKAYY